MPYCSNPVTVQGLGGDLELLAGHAERRGERTLCQGHAYRGGGRDTRHHDDGEPPPSGTATNERLHTSSFSDVHLRPGSWVPAWDGRSATSSGRRAPVIGGPSAPGGSADGDVRTSAITPERQPLATLSRNLRDRLRSGSIRRTETPLSQGDGGHRAPRSVGTRSRRADWLPGCGYGPSLADRGPFAAGAQGGSLPVSNGSGSQGMIATRSEATPRSRLGGEVNPAYNTIEPTKPGGILTGSNSGRALSRFDKVRPPCR